MLEKVKVNEIELFDTLISDLKDIITERVWRSREELIFGHAEIGKRVLEDPLYKKYSKQHKDFLEKLARSISISYSELCRSIQFFQKYEFILDEDSNHVVSLSSESFAKLKEGKNLSWNLIKQKYLPQIKGDTKLQLTPKYKIGEEVAINLEGAIILVKDTGRKIVYKVELDIGEEKEDAWINEEFLSKKK